MLLSFFFPAVQIDMPPCTSPEQIITVRSLPCIHSHYNAKEEHSEIATRSILLLPTQQRGGLQMLRPPDFLRRKYDPHPGPVRTSRRSRLPGWPRVDTRLCELVSANGAWGGGTTGWGHLAIRLCTRE
jgi:hypothetical protein